MRTQAAARCSLRGRDSADANASWKISWLPATSPAFTRAAASAAKAAGFNSRSLILSHRCASRVDGVERQRLAGAKGLQAEHTELGRCVDQRVSEFFRPVSGRSTSRIRLQRHGIAHQQRTRDSVVDVFCGVDSVANVTGASLAASDVVEQIVSRRGRWQLLGFTARST